MQKHSEEWLYQEVPALDGQTPMEAVKTGEGRRKVIELLKSLRVGAKFANKINPLSTDPVDIGVVSCVPK